MTMDKVVIFFQVCHATDQRLHEQCQGEAVARIECKEVNQEKDAADKKLAASCRNNSLSITTNEPAKRGCTENLCHHCQSKVYDIT